MVDSVRGRLTATLAGAQARPLTTLSVVAGVLIFLLLLGGNASVAILVALLVVPVAILFYLTRLDLYEREPWPLLASVVGAGALVGLLGGLLATFVFERFWFSDSRLNLGAIGFSGISANGEGSVPVGVLLLGGILIPVLTGAAILGGPIALRRWPVFRNEITDGMTLGGLAAAGFATVSSFVYFWPSAFDDLPDRPVSQWTAMLAGIVVIRPVVLILAGSLLGIAAWQYLSTRDIRAVLVAGVSGIFGWLALPLGSLLLAQSGAVTEFIWYAVVLIIVGVVFRHALGRSLVTDQQILAPSDGEQRVVCPNCHRVTPDGSFCSFCRAPLHPEAPAVLGSVPPTDPVTSASPERTSADTTFAPSRSSVGDPPDQSPFRARDTQADEGRRRFEPDADPGSDDDSAWLGDVAAGPEADALDHADRSSGDSDPTAWAPDSRHPVSSDDSMTVDDTSSSPARFKRAQTDDRPLADPVETNVRESGVVDPDDAEAAPALTTQPVEPVRPISLQDWSRRSDSGPESDATEPRDAHDVEPPATSARPASPWSRAAEPGPEPASGLRWPTGAASSSDRLQPPNQSRSETASETGDDGSAPDSADQLLPLGDLDQRPVSSSSGRWFDASSGRGPSTFADPKPETPPYRPDEDSRTSNDASTMTPDEEPISIGSAPPPVEPAELDLSDGPTSPSSLRWSRQDDEDEGTESSPDNLDAGSPEDDRPMDPVLDEAPEPIAPAGDPRTTSETERRQGIWRSFSRQGRGGTPRAPHRDQNRSGDGT